MSVLNARSTRIRNPFPNSGIPVGHARPVALKFEFVGSRSFCSFLVLGHEKIPDPKVFISNYISFYFIELCFELFFWWPLSCKKTNHSSKFKENFQAVTATEEFVKRANGEELVSLLRCNEISVSSENDVFSTALRWIQFDADKRRPFASEFFFEKYIFPWKNGKKIILLEIFLFDFSQLCKK